MEKVANIIVRHVQGREAASITMVGGCSAFPGMAGVVEDYAGIPTQVPDHPMLVTPLGMALHDRAR